MVVDAALVVRADRDSPENGNKEGPMAYGNLWMGYVLNSLRWRGGVRKDLRGDDAVGEKFKDAVESLDPSCLIGCGHGSPDTWTGQYIEDRYSTLLTPYNAGLMEGRVVYLLSCLTGQKLGPEIVSHGALAYGGYTEEFVWTVESPESPATDKLAAPFGNASTTFPKLLVGGKTVSEAREKALAVFEAEMEKWEKSEDPYAREVVKWLNFDMQAFTVLGDEEATGLDPKLAQGIVITAVIGVSAVIGIILYRRRRK